MKLLSFTPVPAAELRRDGLLSEWVQTPRVARSPESGQRVQGGMHPSPHPFQIPQSRGPAVITDVYLY